MVKGMDRNRFSEPHVSGSMVERDLLGEISTEYFDRYKNATYVPYTRAMAMIKESQPFDPTDPEPRFANDLHATVAEKLGLDDYGQLQFYTAVSKTHFDVFHGVDAFFELRLESEGGRTTRATIDLTTRPKETWKADVLVTVPDEGFDLMDPEDKKKYHQCIEQAVQQLVAVLQAKPTKQ